MWQWLKGYYHKLASPKYFYEITSKWLPVFVICATVLLVAGSVWALVFAPQDYQQGNSFRIFYIHVPAASLSLTIYLCMAIASLVALVWRIKIAEVLAKSAAGIGASMAFMALVTGALWGKPTWGTYWVWDARLTSMLILWFLYIGIIALQYAIRDAQAAAKATSILTLVGVVNLPIIKYSVDWWNTLHQSATFTVTQKPAMPDEMWLPFVVMLLGFYAFAGMIVIIRARSEILLRERRSKWVKRLYLGER